MNRMPRSMRKSTSFGAFIKNACRRAEEEAGPISPTQASRYVRAISYESPTPALRINALLGTQTTPPDIAVEPPTMSVFSKIKGRCPASMATMAAVNAAVPLPTMSTSNSSSHLAVTTLSSRRRAIAAISPLLKRVLDCATEGSRRCIKQAVSARAKIGTLGIRLVRHVLNERRHSHAGTHNLESGPEV